MTTQQDCSLGISAAEGTFGTYTVIDRWYEFTSESLERIQEIVQGQGLRVGSRVPRSARRAVGKHGAGGGFTLEAPSKGIGRLFEGVLGTATHTLVSGTTYQSVCTPATTGPVKSYSIQKGVPPIGGGTTNPFTFLGSVFEGFELSAPTNDIVSLSFDVTSREVVTSQGYVAPSYSTPIELFTYAQGAITYGTGAITAPTTTALGSSADSASVVVKNPKVSWKNNLDDDGWTMGGAGRRNRKPEYGIAEGKISFEAEYSTNTLYDAYVNQTQLGLVLTFTGLTALSTGFVTLQVVIPAFKLDGDTPKAANGDVVRQQIEGTILDNLTQSPIYIVIRTADTAL